MLVYLLAFVVKLFVNVMQVICLHELFSVVRLCIQVHLSHRLSIDLSFLHFFHLFWTYFIKKACFALLSWGWCLSIIFGCLSKWIIECVLILVRFDPRLWHVKVLWYVIFPLRWKITTICWYLYITGLFWLYDTSSTLWWVVCLL